MMNSLRRTRRRRFGDASPAFGGVDSRVEFQIAPTASGVIVRRSLSDGRATAVDATAHFIDVRNFLDCCKLDAALAADPQLEAGLVNLFSVVHAKVRPLPRARRGPMSNEQISSAVVDAIRHVRDATRVEQVAEAMHRATRALGAGASFYMNVESGSGCRRILRLVLDCDPAWCYGYGSGCHWALDPWIGPLLLSPGPVVVGDLQPRDERQCRVVELRRESGFRSSMLIPVRGARDPGAFGGLCLGSAIAGRFEDEADGVVKVLAQSLALEIHEWFLANRNMTFAPEARS